MENKKLIINKENFNTAQYEAVNWGKEPLLVLAGPGSGKTRVLTYRIARILYESQGQNFRILGLTFTNKAADEMRTRVNNLVPDLGDRLFLGTFHSFCADVLRQHGTHMEIKPNFNIYSQENDLQAILDKAVGSAMSEHNMITSRDKKILPIIKRLKSLLVPPDEVSNYLKDKALAERVAIVYSYYEKELNKNNALDFNSLIYKTYELFKKYPAFAKRYRTVYPYICVDEFQDTNKAQYKLMCTLLGNSFGNLFVVADDDQIIYQWNGASYKRIEQLVEDFEPKVIQLPVNYRCPPEIVELANNLIQFNFLRSKDKKPLESYHQKLEEDTVRVLSGFADYQEEAEGISDDILERHQEELGTVVILARSRRLLEGALTILQNKHILAVVAQRKDEFTSAPFVWLHSILRLANERQNKEYLEAVCGAFLQLTNIEIDLDDIMSQAQSGNYDYLKAWIKLTQQNANSPDINNIIQQVEKCLVERNNIKKFSDLALKWFDSLCTEPHSKHSDPMIEKFSEYGEEAIVWKNLLREILRSLGQGLTLEAFLQELQMHSKEAEPDAGTVRLMSIHAAKGKEFDHVYLIGMVDDELPSFQSKQKGDRSPEMEEERRSCFVAITRTIKTLTLSCANRYRGWEKKPSRFLIEMGLLKEQDIY